MQNAEYKWRRKSQFYANFQFARKIEDPTPCCLQEYSMIAIHMCVNPSYGKSNYILLRNEQGNPSSHFACTENSRSVSRDAEYNSHILDMSYIRERDKLNKQNKQKRQDYDDC